VAPEHCVITRLKYIRSQSAVSMVRKMVSLHLSSKQSVCDDVIRYVMSDEMSSACATYAQWLDDSTQVSAKDLVTPVIFLCPQYYTVGRFIVD